MFKLKSLMLSMLIIGNYAFAETQQLPTQPLVGTPVEVGKVMAPNDLLTSTNKDLQVTDIEKKNIKEIYDSKVKYPQFELGVRYYFGTHGLTQDYNKAVYWLANSSQDEENANADMMIASMYYEGKGFPQNTEKAISFYTRAANRNSLEAQLILTSIFFFNSEQMNQEYANYWIYKAIDNKGRQAELLRSLILLKPEDYKSIEKMIPAYEKYSEYGNEMAQFTLGYFYFTGKVVSQDFSKAIKYLSLSAINKNPISIIMIDEVNKMNINDLSKNNAIKTVQPSKVLTKDENVKDPVINKEKMELEKNN